jgi:hypothetical protein
MSNQMVLYPYRLKKSTTWVFDDESKGLKAEAFVRGMSEIISGVVHKKRIKNAKKGFKITFSDQPCDHDIMLTWFAKDDIELTLGNNKFTLPGNWYHTGNYFKKGPKAGWLCPALLKFFDKPPEKLYAKAEPLPTGIDPIWHKPETPFAFVPGQMDADLWDRDLEQEP